MINLVKSNHMEALLEAFIQLMTSPLGDPMASEWIGVQSRGMRQWLSLSIARHMGICSNIFFAYPRQMIQEILTKNKAASFYLEPAQILWSVMNLLDQSKKEHEPVMEYVKNDPSGKKHVQLSFRITQVLDDYQIWRPDLLSHWEKASFQYRGRDRGQEIWQAGFWNQILQHYGHTRKMFHEVIQKTEQGQIFIPAHRIFLFGISTMPPSFMNFFHMLSRHIPVYMFILSPSNQFFMDMVSKREMGRMLLTVHKEFSSFSGNLFYGQEYYETGNPLLTSLGVTGQQFHEMLEEFGYTEPFEDLFTDPAGPWKSCALKDKVLPVPMLQRIQSDILHLTTRSGPQGQPKVPIQAQDSSISIHSCHSALREAQVVKDLLLDAFETDPSLRPHDVIVMMPDIEAYAPIITSVFSLGADQNEPHIPFSISDRRRIIESSTIETFIHILEMKDSRMERDQVLDLLSCKSIARKFDLSSQDMDSIRNAVLQTRIFWGRDKEHRKQLMGSETEENTWMFGLNRLLMGYAMDGETMTGSVLARPFFEGLQSEILGKFVHFCHSLFGFMDLLEGSKSIDTWAGILRQAVTCLMDENPSTQTEINLLFSTIDKMAQDAGAAHYTGRLEFAPVFEILKHFLDTHLSQGHFSTGAVTFCNLMPMRSIPFQVVVLMGMDEKSFPRKILPCSFDLMAKFPRTGDRNLREEDRYLFLETILSARKRLIISYTGKSLRDNSILPCSGVVSELMEVMDQTFVFPQGFSYYFSHFLHGFHPEYFISQPVFFSFSPGMLRMAEAQASRKKKPSLRPKADQSLPQATCLAMEEVIHFFEHPARYYLEQGLHMKIVRIQEPDPARESFQIQGLDRYFIADQYMKMEQAGTAEDLHAFFRAAGKLPAGKQGDLQFFKIQNKMRPLMEKIQSEAPRNPLSLPMQIHVDIFPWTLTGAIDHLYQDGRTVIRWIAGAGRITPRRLLTQWIIHLALNIHIKESPETIPFDLAETKILGQGPGGKLPALYEFSPLQRHGKEILEPLLKLFSQGQDFMIPFFPETSFALAEALGEGQFSTDHANLKAALAKARKFWFQPFGRTGEKADPCISRVLGQEDPFASMEDLRLSGIPETALMVYQPLLEHLVCDYIYR